MSIYQKADIEVTERGARLVEKHHFDLHNHELKIDYIFAFSPVDDNGVRTCPAVTHGGYPAYALARILGPKDRVMGRGDCEIVIDGDVWPTLTDEQRDALLDHELEHFQIKRDKYNAPVLDDIHRPKLKLKKHDHQFGWFDIIAARHGGASIEVRQFSRLCANESGQFYLPFVSLENSAVAHGLRRAVEK